jgi:thiol-disulfide isomerase/thioredoxin
MNRNFAVLLVIAVLTIPLIYLFIPDSKPGTVSSLEGVTLSTVKGQKFKLSGLFSDKPIMLVFWSIRCGTCIEEIPFVSELHENLNKKLTIIGVHPPGYPLKKIRRFIKRYPRKIPYMLAIDDKMKLCQTYKVSVLPKTVMIDNRGKVLYEHVGFEPTKEKELRNEIISKL